MAAMRPRSVPSLGGMFRALPLLPVLGYVGMALVMFTAYEQDASFTPSCYTVFGGVECPPARGLWLSLAALWSISAVALAILSLLELVVSRRGRGVPMPGSGLLASGVFVSGLGIVWFWAAQQAGWGRVPYSLAYALFFTYVTSSLFLFGLTFLGGVPRRGPYRGWSLGLATGNLLVGLLLGYLFADAVLHPPVFA